MEDKKKVVINHLFLSPYYILLGTSILWALGYIVSKEMTLYASPVTFTCIRWIIAILFLVPIVWFKEGRLFPPKKVLFHLLIMGVAGVGAFNIFLLRGLEHTSATQASLISALNPILIAVLAFLFFRQQLGNKIIISLIISTLGILLFNSSFGIGYTKITGLHVGDLELLASVVAWSIYSLVSEKVTTHTSVWMATLWSAIFGLLLLLPFSLFTFQINHIDMKFWLYSLYIGFGATVLATILWNVGVQKIGATQAGLFLNFTPIFTFVFSYLFFKEQMSWQKVLGTILVFGGVLFFQRNRNQF